MTITNLIVYIMGLANGIAIMLMIIILAGCTSTPIKEFNSDDQQDGSCYATMGGIRGYCNAIDEKTIDVFCNNCYYNEAE